MPRKCSQCKKSFTKGFHIEPDEYFCSEKCLFKNYTKGVYNKLYHHGFAYWSTWEEEEL